LTHLIATQSHFAANAIEFHLTAFAHYLIYFLDLFYDLFYFIKGLYYCDESKKLNSFLTFFDNICI